MTHVPAAGLRSLDRVERHRGRVAAAFRADEIGVRPLCPDLQLLGRGPKRVRGGQDHRPIVLVQAVGEP